MKIGIMQPYFFPFLGYFVLIKITDKFVILDEVQFIRHGWIERNRILKPGDGWQYIKVPLEKHNRDILIKSLRIRVYEDWKSQIFRQLEHYKKKAPFYNKVIEFLNEAFLFDTYSITHLNVHLLMLTCKYIGIENELIIFSEMKHNFPKVEGPGGWALSISKTLKASVYINPINGMKLFHKNDFIDEGIDLKFLVTDIRDYKQGNRQFEPSLSIIDVMMFNSPEAIREMMNYYEFDFAT